MDREILLEDLTQQSDLFRLKDMVRELYRLIDRRLVSVDYAATVVFDADEGESFYVLLTGNITGITIKHPFLGRRITIIFHQDGSGGHTVAGWGAEVLFVGGSLEIDSTADKYTSVTLEYDSNDKWVEVSRTKPSGQIKFPASQSASADANTLDDYEEGTWTPTILFGAAAVDVAYSTQVGTYTKIGNCVHVQGHILLSNNGTSTGAFSIANLPFTARATANLHVPVSVRFVNISFANQLTGIVGNSSTAILVYETATNGAETTITNADVADTARISFNATYYV